MFKAGDIVTLEGCHLEGYHGNIVFRIHNVRWDYYWSLAGIRSDEKRWLASGTHIGSKYHGAWVNSFHLEDCVLYSPICKFKKLKSFSMTE